MKTSGLRKRAKKKVQTPKVPKKITRRPKRSPQPNLNPTKKYL